MGQRRSGIFGSRDRSGARARRHRPASTTQPARWRQRDAMIDVRHRRSITRCCSAASPRRSCPMTRRSRRPSSWRRARRPRAASASIATMSCSSLINALAARYPVSRKILWPDTFEGAARLFVTMQPPRSPVLLRLRRGLSAIPARHRRWRRGGICRRHRRTGSGPRARLSRRRRRAAVSRSLRAAVARCAVRLRA